MAIVLLLVVLIRAPSTEQFLKDAIGPAVQSLIGMTLLVLEMLARRRLVRQHAAAADRRPWTE